MWYFQFGKLECSLLVTWWKLIQAKVSGFTIRKDPSSASGVKRILWCHIISKRWPSTEYPWAPYFKHFLGGRGNADQTGLTWPGPSAIAFRYLRHPQNIFFHIFPLLSPLFPKFLYVPLSVGPTLLTAWVVRFKYIIKTNYIQLDDKWMQRSHDRKYFI